MRFAAIGTMIALASSSIAVGETVAPLDLKGASVSYAPANQVKIFPAPSVVYHVGSGVTRGEKARLHDTLVIPIIRASSKAISMIVVEVAMPKPSALELTVYWTDALG